MHGHTHRVGFVSDGAIAYTLNPDERILDMRLDDLAKRLRLQGTTALAAAPAPVAFDPDHDVQESNPDDKAHGVPGAPPQNDEEMEAASHAGRPPPPLEFEGKRIFEVTWHPNPEDRTVSRTLFGLVPDGVIKITQDISYDWRGEYSRSQVMSILNGMLIGMPARLNGA